MTAKQSSTLILLVIFLSLCLTPTFASAKDIKNEQRNAYKARKLYNKNRTNHQNLLTRISRQEKRVADEQEKLDKLTAEEATARAKLEKSKVDLDAKVRTLNEAWDLRNQ
jgi:septal ring factor EnvC (AmiA/AmiB activator)